MKHVHPVIILWFNFVCDVLITGLVVKLLLILNLLLGLYMKLSEAL